MFLDSCKGRGANRLPSVFRSKVTMERRSSAISQNPLGRRDFVGTDLGQCRKPDSSIEATSSVEIHFDRYVFDLWRALFFSANRQDTRVLEGRGERFPGEAGVRAAVGWAARSTRPCPLVPPCDCTFLCRRREVG